MEGKRVRISLFYAVISLFWMSLYAYVPILSTYSRGEMIGATAAFAGTILGSYGITQLILRVPLGILSDKLGRKKIFVITGCAVSVISGLGLAFSTTPVMLLIFRGLAGVAASAWVTFTVLFSSYFKPEDAPQAMTRAMAFNNLGQMVAMLLGGQIAQLLGSRAAFFLAAGFGVLALLASLWVTENRPENAKAIKIVDLLKVGTDKQLLFMSFLAILYQLLNQGTTFGFTPNYLAELGGTPAQQGYLTSISTFGTMSMSFLASKVLLKKFPNRWCIWIGQLLTATATCLIPLLGRSVYAVFALQLLIGMGTGLSFPLLMGIAIKNVSLDKRGAAMGFFQSIYALGMFIGPVLTGFLGGRFNLSISIACVGSLGFLAFAAAFIGLRKRNNAASYFGA